METAINEVVAQAQSTPTATGDGHPADPNAPLREALAAYWDTGCQDEALRAKITALPNGAAALAKGEQIRKSFEPFAGTGVPVDEFLREKHAEARREFAAPDR